MAARRARSAMAAGVLAGLALWLVGCEDVLLDGPVRVVPGPRCGPGLELDPDVGGCVPERCTDDDACSADRRCDKILGECVPCDAGACFEG